MRQPSEKELKELRNKYPEGSRVKLLHMDDFQRPPIGTLGTVRYVDDMGSVGIFWDNGSSLSVIPDAGDEVEILVPDFTGRVREQIMKIRDSGEINMLLVNTVQWIANRDHYYDLVVFLIDHQKEYVHFIMTGKIC